MAAADYRLCDICEGKAFYDSNLCYEDGRDAPEREPYRIAGAPQYADDEINKRHGYRLGYLGDWAVLCSECAKSFMICIVPVPGVNIDGEKTHVE